MTVDIASNTSAARPVGFRRISVGDSRGGRKELVNIEQSVKRRLRELWLALRALQPKTAQEKRAEASLRSEIRGLSALAAGSEVPKWTQHRRELRTLILRRDPRFFRRWLLIQQTMRAGSPYVELEKQELAVEQPKWSRFSTDPDGNRSHMAYHLAKFEASTSTSIEDYGRVLEFGGGYGEMARIVRETGMSGSYTIVDLPELSALQRYYLSLAGIDDVAVSDIDGLTPSEVTGRDAGLFIATWSLSESPLAVRQKIERLLGQFDGFLISYSKSFSGIDNEAYFDDLQSSNAEIRWESVPLPHLPGEHCYLFGKRRNG